MTCRESTRNDVATECGRGAILEGLSVAGKTKMTAEGAELLQAVKQMKAGKKGRVYTPEQLLAISARRSVKLTQRQFAKLLNVSIDSVQDWEQGRRSPRGAAKTVLRVVTSYPEVLQKLSQRSLV